ncbi:1,4-beta-xylanase [Isoptericola sp. b441]|uniref:1,4-beta-xylanase n=1 Tax=Actinotalea lenta TaxID=3064654 RepID=A0ABT9D8P6_9CELL|nr:MULTISPECIES: 1,4-beta-xylanase [unclassified Isoptericola]MDO8107267.1 1,4-beta-xylanase [Isoptericola sp. b441]MDO8121070.1 1,4-beta-xylanase [Isoptericola sp. b490]
MAETAVTTTPRALPPGAFHAMTWGWTGVRGTWTSPAAKASMDAMTTVHPTWVVLAYAALQDTAQSTQIHWQDAPALTDDDVRSAVAQARSLGLKVCLKPTVNVADGTWRAHIGFFDRDVPGEPTWDEWFDSYDRYILHHARLAEELGAEMFAIGCELVRADAQEGRWRRLAARVREAYSGPITYNCDKYQEDRLTWWDAVDVISSSGYYPTGTWDQNLARIRAVAEQHAQEFVFLEAGCPSRDTSPQRPNDWSLPGTPDEQAQADYLEEMFTALAREPWVRGVALWDWPPELYPPSQAATNGDYCVYGKVGAAVVARHFADAGASTAV